MQRTKKGADQYCLTASLYFEYPKRQRPIPFHASLFKDQPDRDTDRRHRSFNQKKRNQTRTLSMRQLQFRNPHRKRFPGENISRCMRRNVK